MRLLKALLLVFILAFPVVAQEMPGSELTDAALHLQTASAGSFEALEDGGYTLSLDTAEQTYRIFLPAPLLNIREPEPALIAQVWQLADEDAEEAASVPASLTLDDRIITMQLSNPAFDDETQMMTYTAQIERIVVTSEDGKPEAPATFSSADLLLDPPPGFEMKLVMMGANAPAALRSATSNDERCADLLSQWEQAQETHDPETQDSLMALIDTFGCDV